ncbi:MAG TPA: CocE/NonD family hydrolase [Acidimicrobiales bacterium]
MGVRSRTIAAMLAVLFAFGAATACVPGPGGPGAGRPDGGGRPDGFDRLLRGTEPAPWDVRAGVEQLTVTGAEPGQPLTLYGRGPGDPPGRRPRRLLTLLADEHGQAHFAYVPGEHRTLQSGPELDLSDLGDVQEGGVVAAGTYIVRDDSAAPRLATERIRVLGRDDVPDPELYERQELTGVELDVLGGLKPGTSYEDGFQYLEMRDGVRLSAMVRFPDSALYGPGPYPTVIEYSGYGPSNPGSEEPGARLARTLGYATVSVNMRGTGCSGGVFDVFNPAQAADGYDIVEIVGRQPWVKDGRVGMVGLSYSGISQLYVAATRPPHLAAVTPQSVIADPWLQQWPGGIYNSGFTEQWLAERERQSAPGGTSWVRDRIEAGDETCAAHQALRNQNPDFRDFGRALTYYHPMTRSRDLRELVRDIDDPVFLSGAFQDEQTGAQFTTMVDQFDDAPVLRVNLWNGRHPDGYGPVNVVRWFEFLELYVAGRVPRMHPLVRAAAPAVLADQFDVEDVELEGDRLYERFGDDFAAARAAYEGEQPVRVVFESGAGADEVGEPGGTFELALPSWPAPDVEARRWYLGPDETLTDEPPGGRPGRRSGGGADRGGRGSPGGPGGPGGGHGGGGSDGGADAFRYDAEAGDMTLFGGTGEYPLLARVWDTAEWTRPDPGEELSYLTEPLAEDLVVAGPGYAHLWVRSEVEDVTVQVAVSEVRPDGIEYLVQNGWLRLGHRAVDEERSDELEITHHFTEDAYRPVRPGRWTEVQVEIPSVGHVFRAGSRLRLTVGTPGRNHATWEFDNPDYGGELPTHAVARTRARPSGLVLGVLDGVDVPAVEPVPCPGLRGQACRPFVPTENLPA